MNTATKQLIVAILLYFTVGYINEFVAMNQVYHTIDHPPMFDRGHNALPLLSKSYPNIGIASILLYFVLRWGIEHPSSITNFLWIVSLLFIGRVVILSVTQFPPATTGCSTIKPGDPFQFNVLEKDWNECLDYMYSGHTIHAVLVVLFTLYLSDSTLEKVFITLLGLLELLYIIGSRIHYTADVLVGSLITILAFFAWPGIDELSNYISSGGMFGKILKAKFAVNI